MSVNFQVTGLSQHLFKHLFQLEKEDLSKLGVIKMQVDEKPRFSM